VPGTGDVIAQKYRVEGVVGAGGMGVVVSARHVQLGHVVAIKLLTLPPDENRRVEAVARFLHEAQAAARLQSDHVVRIYDVGQLDNGLPFMVMELLAGSDLGSLLEQRGAMPEAVAVDYLLQACAGVSEAHRMGIVHRDLKPSNLFVTQRSDGLPLLKVLDFGISKQLSDPDSGEAAPNLTNTRTLMGSPHYMSPEQIRDARRVDARTDVWALGVILQELLTDAPAFRGESFPGICAAIVADPPTPVRSMRPDVSPALEALIARCLEKNIALRFQSVAELASSLMMLGTRTQALSDPRQLAYSSHPRIIMAPHSAADPSQASAPTLALQPAPEATLESARLRTTGSTQTSLAASGSRVAVIRAPGVGGTKRSKAAIGLALAGAATLLTAGTAWLAQRPVTPVAAVTASAPAPSVPSPAVSAMPFTLTIDSEPASATVSEGSVRLGTTPFSLALTLPEGASPRVFVLERAGFLPYTVRQGSARGEVRIMAALSPRPSESPPPSVPAAAPSPARVSKTKQSSRVVKQPASAAPKAPSDIRLER